MYSTVMNIAGICICIVLFFIFVPFVHIVAACDSGKTLLPQLQLVLDAKKLGKAAGKAAGGKPPSGPGAKFVNEDHPLALAFLRCTIDPRNANMYALVVSTMEALKSLPVHYTVSTSCVVRVRPRSTICFSSFETLPWHC